MMKPGEDIVILGLADLDQGKETIYSLLLSIGAPRLRSAGISVPDSTFVSPELVFINSYVYNMTTQHTLTTTF